MAAVIAGLRDRLLMPSLEGRSGSGSEGVFVRAPGGGVPALPPFSGRLMPRLLVLVYALYSIEASIAACATD